MDKVKGTDKTIRMICIPWHDNRPKRRTWYKYLAKVGTTCGTVVWADKEELKVGDTCYYIDAFIPLDDKKRYIAYPSSTYAGKGLVDMINDEGRIFIAKA